MISLSHQKITAAASSTFQFPVICFLFSTVVVFFLLPLLIHTPSLPLSLSLSKTREGEEKNLSRVFPGRRRNEFLIKPISPFDSLSFQSFPSTKTPNYISLIPQFAAMNTPLVFLLLLVCSSIVSAHEKLDSHVLPRPLILEYPETLEIKESEEEELRLWCTSWRFAVEANNVSPWKTIPDECAGYVKDYMMNKGYVFDLEMVAKEAGVYVNSLVLGDDGMDAWVFDIDETLLSNLPYYVDHGYGLEVFDASEFDKWVQKAIAPAIESSLKFYEEVQRLGFKIFLLTGRSERHRSVTVENLKNAGFQNWDKLLLRALDDHGKTATIFKSEKRSEMENEGFRILGNSGDQWSDLMGTSLSNRWFKLPNPMYYIP